MCEVSSTCHNGCGCECQHTTHKGNASNPQSWLKRISIGLSVALLFVGLCLDHLWHPYWFSPTIRILWYSLALFLASYQVLWQALKLIFRHRDLFNEIVLMSVAAIGAMLINEYAEATLLMLLYALGEYLEEQASDKARREISRLIDKRPEYVHIKKEGGWQKVRSQECQVGDTLRLVVGERVALDGKLLSPYATLDTSALTGESLPSVLTQGEEIKAGSIVLANPIEVRVTTPYSQSTLARILQLVEEAAEKKPKTERFMRRFARIYTPIVFAIATLVLLVPYLISLLNPAIGFHFTTHFYNALVVLVTSCPCALIIGIPLSYYSGIGVGSKHGLIFKGALYLERLPKIKHFIFDKTGTLTKGEFIVSKHYSSLSTEQAHSIIIPALYQLETLSTHPLAKAICSYISQQTTPRTCKVNNVKEIAGMGMRGVLESGEEILIGNAKLLAQYNISPDDEALLPLNGSPIHYAYKGQYGGYFLLTDQLKEDSHATIRSLKDLGIYTAILSGDNEQAVAQLGKELAVDFVRGGLLPQEKVTETKLFTKEAPFSFVGDGINDAPLLAGCDVSFAMGKGGSDAAIEAADIIIQSDKPYKTVEAIQIAKKTQRTAVSNIIFALSVKAIVIILTILSFSSLILAIFADMGVTLLVILNAISLLKYTPSNKKER